MIVNIRCFTCGSVISDKWNLFNVLVDIYREEDSIDDDRKHEVQLRESCISKPFIDSFLRGDKIQPSAECKALQLLGIKEMCCRRMFLTTVTLIEEY
jgi:DNA-directed RNA polymerase subunit N (RpoN/RPB10)